MKMSFSLPLFAPLCPKQTKSYIKFTREALCKNTLTDILPPGFTCAVGIIPNSAVLKKTLNSKLNTVDVQDLKHHNT
jgi:hypothetical protein